MAADLVERLETNGTLSRGTHAGDPVSGWTGRY
jgi:hypothetical protein